MILTNIFETIREYLSYPFVVYALVVGVLIALCAALLGVVLVLKRFSYLGDGLSHVAFGALAIATCLKVVDNTLIMLPLTMLAAVILLMASRKRIINGDAAIAMFSVGALSVGYLLLNVFSPSSNIAGDVCTSLFGSTSILTLEQNEVWISLAMCIVVLLFFVLFHNKIFSVSFDEDFARSAGVKTNLYNLALALITAVIIVIAMNLVGSLLISALIIFPALTAMRIMKSFKGVIILSGIIAVVEALVGMLGSIALSTPIGASIVVVNIIGFGISYGISRLKRT